MRGKLRFGLALKWSDWCRILGLFFIIHVWNFFLFSQVILYWLLWFKSDYICICTHVPPSLFLLLNRFEKNTIPPSHRKQSLGVYTCRSHLVRPSACLYSRDRSISFLCRSIGSSHFPRRLLMTWECVMILT